MGFEKLARLVEVNATLTTRSSLAIHSGDTGRPQMSENPIVRIGGQPVIPGSSLKGAMRSALEATLSQAGHTVCIPFTAIPQSVRRGGKQDEYLEKLGRKGPCSTASPCPVCLLFGTAGGKEGLSGTAIFLDAKPTAPVATAERTHVAITRDTRSQSGGALVTLETVDAGTQFEATVRLINPEPWQVGAIIRGLETVALLGLGAKKTAGYGEMDIKVESLRTKRLEDGAWTEEDANREQYEKAFAEFLKPPSSR